MEISITTDICCKPEEVFLWINDPDQAMRWQKGVKSVEIINETPDKIDTTFKEVMEENGKSLEMYGKVIDYVPNELISFQLESKIYKVHLTYSVKSEAENSIVLIESTINWKLPMSIICLFIGPRTDKCCNQRIDCFHYNLINS